MNSKKIVQKCYKKAKNFSEFKKQTISQTKNRTRCRMQAMQLLQTNDEQNIQELFRIGQNKIDIDDLDALTCNKVSKDELKSLLPDVEAQDIKLKEFIEESTSQFNLKVNLQLKKADEKFA